MTNIVQMPPTRWVPLKTTTPHRKMRNVLTDDEWRRFLKNQISHNVAKCMDMPPSAILQHAFAWKISPEGGNYWRDVCWRVRNLEFKP